MCFVWYNTSMNTNIKTLLDTMSQTMYKKYESHSYPCGYLESMMKEMIESMPKKQQAYWIKQIEQATEAAKV